MSAVMTLEDEIDISRGDMIAKPTNLPRVSQDIEMMVCWFSDKKLQPDGRYLVRHTTREVRARRQGGPLQGQRQHPPPPRRRPRHRHERHRAVAPANLGSALL